MIYYKIEYLSNSIVLRIADYQRGGCGTAFIGLVGLFMFLNPILTIFLLSIKITFGTILVCALAWFISGYFVRLYLWNKYGEEVFIIKGKTLETYYDYKFFKDNHRVNHFIKIEMYFFVEDRTICVNDLTKGDLFINSDQLSMIGFNLGEEMISSHTEIPISKIIEIANDIKSIPNYI